MHQALDGTPLVADRPFIPTVQVPPASFTLKSSIILLDLMTKMQIGDASYPVCEAGFSGNEFGVEGIKLSYRERL
jgi:hypothetical protein